MQAIKIAMPGEATLQGAYPKPEKNWPAAVGFIGQEPEMMVPLSAVEALSADARLTDDKLAHTQWRLDQEIMRREKAERVASRSEAENARLIGVNWSLRFKFAAAFGVAVIEFCWIAYTWGQLATGR